MARSAASNAKGRPLLVRLQASTQGLVREMQKQGRAEGTRVLCPVPLVTGGLVEPPVVPRFLQALQVMQQHSKSQQHIPHGDLDVTAGSVYRSDIQQKRV